MKTKIDVTFIRVRIAAVLLFGLLFITACLQSQPANLFPGKDSVEEKKIIIIGDTQRKGFLEYFIFHEDNSKKTRILFKKIADEKPELVVHLGDVTAFGSSKKQWEYFESDALPLTEKNIKIYPVFGNHEYYGNNAKCYENFYDHFPYISRLKWYSFVNNKIGFVMINSNYDNLSVEEIKAQKKWYLNLLDSMDRDSNIDYVIVCGHHPPYTNSTVVDPDEEIRTDFAFPFRQYKKSTVYFSGHCHSYEKFLVDGKYFIVSGGGGGSRQKLNIDKKTRAFDDLFEGPELRFFHYSEITVESDHLLVRIKKLNIDQSMSVVDEVKIRKD